MKYKETTLDSFSLVGISVRTNNNKAAEDIGKLWKDFMSNYVADDITDRLSDDIYCVYTDYESDKNGAYTVLLGYKVSNTNEVSGEYDYKDLPGGKYYKFIAEGEIPASTNKVWEYIRQADIRREYLADFEVYSPETINNKNNKVEVPIYLSVQ